MTKPLKIAIGIIASLLIILAALFFFFKYLITKSYPEYEGELTLHGIKNTVHIYRDKFGVPHIFAENEHDLMFAVGYVHAQDRLWQMDITRRAGEGRLSEIFGKETVDYDKLFRTLNLNEVIEKIERELTPDVHAALTAYTDGINEFITSHKGKYPIEFDILDYAPEPWQVKHSLLISRLMAWELNFSWWVDITLGKLFEKVDLQKAVEAFPDYPENTPVIVETETKPKKISQVDYRILKGISSASGFLEVFKTYKNFFGGGGSAIGSNSWVINSSLSLSGKPILANDPHLDLPAPSKWYELHLSAPDWNVSGVTLPGTPFVVIGHNDRIAWGLTNAMIDESDFYIEKIDSVDHNNYIYEKKSLPIEKREEIIYIGKKDSVEIIIKNTHHGPVISDIHPSKKYPEKSSTVISMKWVGFEPSREAFALYLINKSKTAEEFTEGVREFKVPGQNFIYADVDGNIGYWLGARIPIRGRVNPTLPQPGWSSEYEWKGYISFDQLPKIWNPKENLIVTANNKITNDSPYFISNLFMPPSRAIRIKELLQSSKKFEVKDIKRIQLDYISPQAREITKILLNIYDKSPTDDDKIISALEYLKNWDFKHDKSDIATSIYNMFFVKLLHNIFEDEMGQDLFSDYMFFSAVPINAVDKIIKSGNSSWFDNINTEETENMDDIFRKSLRDAIRELRLLMGLEMRNWGWGNLHTVKFEHPLGDEKTFDKIFNVGPFEIGGSMLTINNGEYKLNFPFKNFVGPSTRQIFDLSKPLERSSVISTGQSGQPMHRHYKDQTPLWLNGEYKRITMDKDEIMNSKWKRLILKEMKNKK